MEQGDPAVAEVKARLTPVKHKILVLSGKGGVGKSTFSCQVRPCPLFGACNHFCQYPLPSVPESCHSPVPPTPCLSPLNQLAWFLSNLEFNVGILDIDICGPSVPKIMGVESHEVRKSSFGWSPVYAAENLAVMSIGFMLDSKNDAVIWRGPRKNGLIKQFLTEVYWGDLDVLLVDAPPGTSDEHLSITSYLKDSSVDGAIIVTTPQEVSLLDVRKELTFCQRVGVPVLGVVENMAGFTCPHCSETTAIFEPSSGGAAAMCAEMGVPFLGSIPLDPYLMRACEQGRSYAEAFPAAPAVHAFKHVVGNLFGRSEALAATAGEHELGQRLDEHTAMAQEVAAREQAQRESVKAALAAGMMGDQEGL